MHQNHVKLQFYFFEMSVNFKKENINMYVIEEMLSVNFYFSISKKSKF